MFLVKAEQEKEGVRKKVAGFEGSKLMQTNERDLDQFSLVLFGILLGTDADRSPM